MSMIYQVARVCYYSTMFVLYSALNWWLLAWLWQMRVVKWVENKIA